MTRTFVWMIVVCLCTIPFSTQTQAQREIDYNAIDWVDLGKGAWYPGFSGISEGQSVVVNNKLYVFGGYERCCIPIRKAYVFDPTVNTWQPLPDMPQGTTHTGIATDGTDIYLAGGYVETPDLSYRIPGHEKVWRYNVELRTYTPLPNLPKKASTGQLVYVNGKLHYIGGTTPETQIADLPDHFVFDLDAHKANPEDPSIGWIDITQTAPLPNPRQHSGAVVVDGKIYYIGGQYHHNNTLVPQDDVHRYDPMTNQWEKLGDMPAPRNHMSNTIVVWNGQIIVLSGQSNHEVSHADAFIYYPAENRWTTLGTMPIGQHSAIAGVINGEIYFGTGDKGYSNNERRRMRKGTLVYRAPTPTPTASDTPTITPLPTDTLIPTLTFTPTSTYSPSKTSTPSSTFTATWTPPATSTPTLISTLFPTESVSFTPTSTEQALHLVENGGFEQNTANISVLPAGWKIKRPTGDKVKCNTDTKSFAYKGECAFAFKGGIGENVRLQQKIDITSQPFTAGDTLEMSIYANAKSSLLDAEVRVIIKFSDGTGKISKALPLTQTQKYQPFMDTILLPSGSIASLKVMVVHTSTSGKLLIDDISLKLIPQNTTRLLPSP